MFGIVAKKEVLRSAEKELFEFNSPIEELERKFPKITFSTSTLNRYEKNIEKIRDENIFRLKCFNNSRLYETLDLSGINDLDDNIIILLAQELLEYNDSYCLTGEIHSPIRIIIFPNSPYITDRGVDPFITIVRRSSWIKEVNVQNLPKVSETIKVNLEYELNKSPVHKEKICQIRAISKKHGKELEMFYGNWIIVRVWSPETIQYIPSLKKIINNSSLIFNSISLGNFLKDNLVKMEDGQFLDSSTYVNALVGDYGHVSLGTMNNYISLWPQGTPTSPIQQVPSEFCSLESDIELKKIPTTCIVLHFFDIKIIDDLYKTYSNSSEYRLINNDEKHNCSSILVFLLKKSFSSEKKNLLRQILKNKKVNEDINPLFDEVEKNINQVLNYVVISPNHVAHLISKLKEIELLFLKYIGLDYDEIDSFDRIPSEFFHERELNSCYSICEELDNSQSLQSSIKSQPSQPDSQPSQPDSQSSQPDSQPSQPDSQPSQPDSQPSQLNSQPSQSNLQPRFDIENQDYVPQIPVEIDEISRYQSTTPTLESMKKKKKEKMEQKKEQIGCILL